MTRTCQAVAFALAAIALTAAPVLAHAYLRHAVPIVGSTIPASPPNLILDFTESVEVPYSGVVVLNAQGQRVDKGDLHAAPGNAKRLVLGLNPLKPGTYTVRWHVMSVDTHKTAKTFTFTVQP